MPRQPRARLAQDERAQQPGPQQVARRARQRNEKVVAPAVLCEGDYDGEQGGDQNDGQDRPRLAEVRQVVAALRSPRRLRVKAHRSG